jgi:hypothetical protein
MLGRGKGTRRLVLAIGVSLTLVLVGAAAAVALGGGDGRPQPAQGDRAGVPAKPADHDAVTARMSSARHQVAGSDARQHASARQSGLSDGDASRATRSASDSTRAAALERAAGFDPKRVKVVPWVPNSIRVKRGEALPCTGAQEPIDFEIFSAGTEVDGIPLNRVNRQCDESAPADEMPANFVSYIYGSCEIPEGQTGCEPPLEIQSFPACQRSYADYSFEGKPLPYRELPGIDGAQVVEIAFQIDQRIEVYTGSSTIVIFASNPAVVEAALESLRSQMPGEPPARRPQELAEQEPGGLVPPVPGATQGELSCRS